MTGSLHSLQHYNFISMMSHRPLTQKIIISILCCPQIPEVKSFHIKECSGLHPCLGSTKTSIKLLFYIYIHLCIQKSYCLEQNVRLNIHYLSTQRHYTVPGFRCAMIKVFCSFCNKYSEYFINKGNNRYVPYSNTVLH